MIKNLSAFYWNRVFICILMFIVAKAFVSREKGLTSSEPPHCLLQTMTSVASFEDRGLSCGARETWNYSNRFSAEADLDYGRICLHFYITVLGMYECSDLVSEVEEKEPEDADKPSHSI
ncbi:hypothetical protein V9T40_005836 [Parthenolecanium corni]|uniref:Uncharacterized protein n=1 Tax=Parthenolecanium corni TaxID=536013 RepID=A0AAN9TT95_9HEMI